MSMEEAAKSGGEGKRVCVTGASGYVASWLVKLLLLRGYSVNATVRSLDDPTKTEHLLALDGAKERLHLYEANLLKEGSFDSAVRGCDGVFHTASPVPLKLHSTNSKEELIDPAVKGTLNVLGSCAKVPSVKRVVFTSSTAVVIYTGRPITEETIVDETWFSTPQGCNSAGRAISYCLSKTLAEDAAWRFVKENGIDMVSILPSAVIGPLLQPTLNFSTDLILHLINGSKTYPNMSVGWVHVKDVAEAHIRAFETPSANGRYIVSEKVAHYSEVVKILRELFPTFKLPNRCEDDKPFAPTYKISKDKIRTLGIDFIPLEVGLKETVESLIEKKFITISI